MIVHKRLVREGLLRQVSYVTIVKRRLITPGINKNFTLPTALSEICGYSYEQYGSELEQYSFGLFGLFDNFLSNWRFGRIT